MCCDLLCEREITRKGGGGLNKTPPGSCIEVGSVCTHVTICSCLCRIEHIPTNLELISETAKCEESRVLDTWLLRRCEGLLCFRRSGPLHVAVVLFFFTVYRPPCTAVAPATKDDTWWLSTKTTLKYHRSCQNDVCTSPSLCHWCHDFFLNFKCFSFQMVKLESNRLKRFLPLLLRFIFQI